MNIESSDIVSRIMDALEPLQTLRDRAIESWTNEHVQLVLSPALPQHLRESARQLETLADDIEQAMQEQSNEGTQ